jgi:hypothetical protein
MAGASMAGRTSTVRSRTVEGAAFQSLGWLDGPRQRGDAIVAGDNWDADEPL